MPTSYVTTSPLGQITSFVGPNATQLFRARVLKNALQLHAKCGIIPSRGITITKMLTLATTYTKKPYRRGQSTQAIEDLNAYCAALEASLPVNP